MEKVKWYEQNKLLDILLFIFPPLAIYGIYKSKKILVPMKILLILIGVMNITVFLLFVLT